jgi:hypothetical protein
LRDGRTRLLADVLLSWKTSDVMFDLVRVGHLCIYKFVKAVNWLKVSLERETRFGHFSIFNDVIPLRLWNARILSSSTINSLDSTVNKLRLKSIVGRVGTPLMDNTDIRAEGTRGCDTVKQGQSWMVRIWRLDSHSF